MKLLIPTILIPSFCHAQRTVVSGQKASGSQVHAAAGRSYCDPYSTPDTTSFLPFGTENGDSQILEVDDGYETINGDFTFGGDAFSQICISANGPVYSALEKKKIWKKKIKTQSNFKKAKTRKK